MFIDFLNEYPFIIAEVAQAHNGSLGNAHAFIDALVSAGTHAVKFKIHIADDDVQYQSRH